MPGKTVHWLERRNSRVEGSLKMIAESAAIPIRRNPVLKRGGKKVVGSDRAGSV